MNAAQTQLCQFKKTPKIPSKENKEKKTNAIASFFLPKFFLVILIKSGILDVIRL